MVDTAVVEWSDDTTLRIGDVEFVANPLKRFPSEPERFCIRKRADLVRGYLRLLDDLRPDTIVELGIYQGGSAALMAMVAQPTSMVAIDLEPERVAALDTFLASRGLADRVHLAYGTSQSDAEAVTAALDAAAIVGPSLDLVVDDASHLVAETRASFEILFPRVRPGGLYVIEDWSWAHTGYETHLPDEQPLTQLVFELTMALPAAPGLITDIHIDRDWAVIRRGEAPIDPETFAVRRNLGDRGRRLLTDGGDGEG